jgi:7-cyano-7-deazaguanine synthase in queuosine biosynthesis
MEQPTILAMYSGGLDSLGMIYRLLVGGQYHGYRVHIHHVHNRNIENRDQAEAVVVAQALAELRQQGFEFEYSTSMIASPVFDQQFMYDSDTINFFAGYLCSVNPHITKVAMGMNATDSNHALEERRQRADKILSAFTDVKKIYPVLNMTKREIYDSLPKFLQDKFWSCRRPVYTESGVESCKQCKSCVQLAEAGIED